MTPNMQNHYLPAAIAGCVSLVMHGFLLSILILVPSPIPEDQVGNHGLEATVAQKIEEKKKLLNDLDRDSNKADELNR